jgi:hypothetical protein
MERTPETTGFVSGARGGAKPLKLTRKADKKLKETKPAVVYQLKIALNYVEPPIWRQVEVPSDITLAKLHRIMQAAMGWHDSHLHQFVVGDSYYGVPELDEFREDEIKDERKARLSDVLSKSRQKIVYEYDFGDGWGHEISLENIIQPKPGVRYPRCVGGARACPPEDCGGARGYEEFLTAIRNPRHSDHHESLYWVGGKFDPEEFKLKVRDAALRRVR